MFSIHLHRHRKAGGHSTPNRAAATTTSAPAGGPAPVYSENKTNAEVYGQQGQQQQYTQQPVQYVQHPDTHPQQEYYGNTPPQHVQSA